VLPFMCCEAYFGWAEKFEALGPGPERPEMPRERRLRCLFAALASRRTGMGSAMRLWLAALQGEPPKTWRGFGVWGSDLMGPQ